jgi:ABC-type phosphate transport system substrate-binding protein
MRRLTTFLIALTLAVWPQAEAASTRTETSVPGLAQQASLLEPLAIVVNKTNPVDNLSMAELHRIFLGNRSHWANGRRITLVMRDPGEPERKAVLRDICGMSEDQFKNHFLHGLFTGEILVSPKILATPVGVRKFIFNVPGAIGFLRASDVDSTVKVVRVDELLPEEKGYKLRVPSLAVN